MSSSSARRRARATARGPTVMHPEWEPCDAHMAFIHRIGLPIECVDAFVSEAIASGRSEWNWHRVFLRYLLDMTPPDEIVGRLSPKFFPADATLEELVENGITKAQALSQVRPFSLYYRRKGTKELDWQVVFVAWCTRAFSTEMSRKATIDGDYTDAHGVRRNKDGVRIA